MGGRLGRTVSGPLPAPTPADSGHLRQEAEVSVQNGTVGPMEEFQKAAREEVEGIGRGQLREEFLLLHLEVQDFCLRVTEGKESGRFRRMRAPYSPPEPQGHRALETGRFYITAKLDTK